MPSVFVYNSKQQVASEHHRSSEVVLEKNDIMPEDVIWSKKFYVQKRFIAILNEL